MTKADIDALSALLAKAAPAPWFAVDASQKTGPAAYNIMDYRAPAPLSDAMDGAWTLSKEKDRPGWGTDGGMSSYGIEEAEAKAIAALRNHADELIALARKAL